MQYAIGFRHESGRTEAFIVNGHSAGGSEGLGVTAARPDLVHEVNMIDSPGGQVLVNEILSNNKGEQSEFLSKVKSYNAHPNIVNTAGTHHPQMKTYIIRSTSHSLESIIRAYKKTGAQEISPAFYNEGGRVHDGVYYYCEKNYFFNKEHVAQKFGKKGSDIEALSTVDKVGGLPEQQFAIKIELEKGDKE